MSKRLQVLMPQDEYKSIKRHAKQARVSLGEWVRGALRRITDAESAREPQAKIKVLRHALTCSAPVDSVETMKKQIESGYLK